MYKRQEYTRQGDPARDNFVGWTGALGIGVIIEDLLGIGLRAPDNAVDWDLRLTEENGISNLYMCHDGQPAVSYTHLDDTDGRSCRIDDIGELCPGDFMFIGDRFHNSTDG